MTWLEYQWLEERRKGYDNWQDAYAQRPSVVCDACGTEFSEPVGRLHRDRLGHPVRLMGAHDVTGRRAA